jgi:hypothetical protein
MSGKFYDFSFVPVLASLNKKSHFPFRGFPRRWALAGAARFPMSAGVRLLTEDEKQSRAQREERAKSQQWSCRALRFRPRRDNV